MIGWRAGSTATSEQTSVRREARRSLTSLWHTVGNPPVGQFRALSVLKGLPKIHLEGSLSRAHPYLSASASLNAPLWMAKTWCCSGRAVSQLEAMCNKMMIYLCHFKLLLLEAMFIIKHSRPLYTAEDRYKGYGPICLMYLTYIYIYITHTQISLNKESLFLSRSI